MNKDREILDIIQSDPNLLKTIKDSNLLSEAVYKEKRVDIMQFIEDPRYLGNATDRGRRVYKIWKDTLYEAFKDDNIIEVIATGAIGTGKSEGVSDIGMAYILYNAINLVNPYETYGFMVGKPLSLVFFNMTLTLSSSTNFMSFQNKLQVSPWFLEHGQMRGNVQPTLYFPLIDYRLCSPRAAGYGSIGGNVIGAVLDEINTPGEPVGVKERAFNAYQGTLRRMESRFMELGTLPGLKLFLCASKDDEMSFLDAHIEKRKKAVNPNTGKKIALVKDVAIWEAKPDIYSGKRFKVAVGDAYHPPRIIVDEREIPELLANGYHMVELPEEHREAAQYDLIGTLRDVAGIAVAGIRRHKLFASEKFIFEVIDKSKPDPVSVDTVFTGLQSEDPWIAYLDTKKFRMSKDIPRCIHLDISISGDAMALAMSGVREWIMGDVIKEEGTVEQQPVPVIETDFILRVKSREGDRIPLHMMRRFVIDLRNLGYKISFTADLVLASEDTLQILNKAKISAKYLSVDRNIQAYLDFRNLVYEHRWLTHEHAQTIFEMKHIEHDRERNKIDHPDEVKDIIIKKDGSVQDIVMQGCFTGETRIALVDGRELNFEELKSEYELGKELWCYSIDKNKRDIVPARISNPRITKIVNQLLRITLDNGESVECTPEHLFMLRDGSYQEAQHLTVGTSLMPLYRRIPVKFPYRQYLNPFEDKWHYEHRRFLGEHIGRDELVHHDNFNHLDNTPNNLKKMKRSAHARLHGELATPEKLKKMHDAAQKFNLSKEGREIHRQALLKTIHLPESKRIQSENGKKNGKLNLINYNKNRQGSTGGSFQPGHTPWNKGKVFVNHKVARIDIVEKIAEVYDLTVEGYQNFALASGVFVHNSKDCLDAVVGSVYQVLQTSKIPVSIEGQRKLLHTVNLQKSSSNKRFLTSDWFISPKSKNNTTVLLNDQDRRTHLSNVLKTLKARRVSGVSRGLVTNSTETDQVTKGSKRESGELVIHSAMKELL